MQCVRCGRVLNKEERRCPQCFASLSNQQISDLEVAKHQLGQLADEERANAWNKMSKRGLHLGMSIGGISCLMSFSLTLIVIGVIIGGLVGWLTAWRRYSQTFCCIAFTSLMALPVLTCAGFSPFLFIVVVSSGMLIGVAIESTMGL